MFEGTVVGTVVASVKPDGLQGAKLMLVRPASGGDVIVACDQAQAGEGDRVMVVTSREATHAMPDRFVPVDAAIVAIIDAVDRSGTSAADTGARE